MPSCLTVLMQVMARAFSRAWFKAGSSIAARIAMIAITTRSSISVKRIAAAGTGDLKY